MLNFDFPPYRLSGVVYVALLNDPATLEALGDAVARAPYKALPRGPVLGLKPRNTLAAGGGTVALPEGTEAMEIAVSLGLVIGRTASRVSVDHALRHVTGCTVVVDANVPADSHYRPNARGRALDGSCIVGPRVVPLAAFGSPDGAVIRVAVDGRQVHVGSTAGFVRGAAALMADVTEFMTLRPGDLLALGAPHGAPRVPAGAAVSASIDGIGGVALRVVRERVAA